MVVAVPSGRRMIMNPPPPMFPALGCVTASAKAVATAASTAFPPFARIAAPTSDAGAEVETTSPALDSTAAESFRTTAAVSLCARTVDAVDRTAVKATTIRVSIFMEVSRWGLRAIAYDTRRAVVPLHVGRDRLGA